MQPLISSVVLALPTFCEIRGKKATVSFSHHSVSWCYFLFIYYIFLFVYMLFNYFVLFIYHIHISI